MTLFIPYCEDMVLHLGTWISEEEKTDDVWVASGKKFNLIQYSKYKKTIPKEGFVKSSYTENLINELKNFKWKR